MCVFIVGGSTLGRGENGGTVCGRGILCIIAMIVGYDNFL